MAPLTRSRSGQKRQESASTFSRKPIHPRRARQGKSIDSLWYRRRATEQDPPESFPCPDAKRLNCLEAFSSQHDASTHAILKHTTVFHRAESGEFSCPMVEKLGCTLKFPSCARLVVHLKYAHSGEGIPCPFAHETDCTFALDDRESYKAILKRFKDHLNARHRQIPRITYPCPLVGEMKCSADFASSKTAKLHADRIHRKIRFPCPLAKEMNCHKDFGSRPEANQHARTYHLDMRHPCPMAKKVDCHKDFVTRYKAKQHADVIHRQLRYPCPLAKETSCNRLFCSPQSANVHADMMHRQLRHPCPSAKEMNCHKDFCSPQKAKRHAIAHTHPFSCPQYYCDKRFQTITQAFEHWNNPQHPQIELFLCPIQECEHAIAGKLLSKESINQHKAKHIKNGSLNANAEFLPRSFKRPRTHSDFSLHSMIVSNNLSIQAKMHVDGRDFESDETSTGEDLECDDFLADEDDNHDHKDHHEGPFLSLKSLSDELEASLSGNEALSIKTRDRVLQQNTTFWSTAKMSVSLIHLGQRCKGSGIGSGLLRVPAEKCQNDVLIDFDTARLFWHDGSVMLDGRCLSCRAAVRLAKLLHSCGLEIQDLGKEICTKDGCARRSFRMSGSCIRHLYDNANAISRDKWAPTKNVDMRSLRNVFQSAVQVKWKPSPAYERVQKLTHEIAQGKRAGSDLVILDDEWSPGSNQLWEFAMVEKVSGKVLINTRVKHPSGLDYGAFGSASFLQTVGEQKAKRVYSSNSQESDADLLTADETASKVKAAGITPNTVILVWGVNRFDLTVLRQYLESAGHRGILPPPENCIPLTQFFRDNLPKRSSCRKRFPLNLEVLFPILFPGHELIGLNHRALEDCLQTRLLLLAFKELCKPVSKRGKAWRPESVTTMKQSSVTSWFRAEDHDQLTAGLKRKFADSYNTISKASKKEKEAT